jgi:1-acyl-sn-glycerol-3-phosphate acyltransferase
VLDGTAAEAALVVPVAIVGSGGILSRDGFRVRPGTIEVRFGAAIPLAGFSPQDRAGLARRAETAVAELLGLRESPRERDPESLAGGTAPRGSAV